MEELIKAKEEQIAKLNDLKELLKKQIITLQEENSNLKNELFEIEEKIKELPNETTEIPDYLSMFNSINAKLSTIIEKLDFISIEGLISSEAPKLISNPKVKKSKSHPAESALIKPSSLFTDPEPNTLTQSKSPQLYQAPDIEQQSLESQQVIPTAADPRSLQRQVLEIDYPENGVIQCPKCNGQQIQEMPEPTRGSFAKKYYCKKCRQEWRYIY